MLWPSLVVVLCGAIFLRLEMRRRRLTLCGRRDPRDANAIDGHTVSSQASAAAASAGVGPAGTEGASVRPGGRVTGSGREMIAARRLPASRGQSFSRPINVFSIWGRTGSSNQPRLCRQTGAISSGVTRNWGTPAQISKLSPPSSANDLWAHSPVPLSLSLSSAS